jgi:transposase
MGHPQRRYAPEFKERCIRLAQLMRERDQRSIRSIAKELEIPANTLRMWVRQADVDSGRREGVTSDERAELVQLRRETRIQQEEIEILKKAEAFFARERARVRSRRSSS